MLALRALRWNDCTVIGTFVSIRQFNEHVGIPFTREQYYDLKTSYTKASKKFNKVGATCMDITEFLTSFKKGSRKFRKILGYEKKSYDLSKLTQVTSFARITSINVPRPKRLKNMYSIWGRGYLNNDVRVFMFKYYNNILGLGHRIAHFVLGEQTGKFRIYTNNALCLHAGMTEEVTLQTSTGAAKEQDGTDEPGTPAKQSEPDETSTGSAQDTTRQLDTERLQD